MNRNRRKQLGLETVAILERGGYEAGGTYVDISRSLEDAVAGTIEYPDRDGPPPLGPRASVETVFEVANETTLAAASRLVAEGRAVAALNFASAKNPGGGFLNGASAQEESLAMASGLHACLAGCAMYEHHRARSDPMYTPWVIYSPDVPVIRDDDGALLPEPYELAFLTSPAPNAGAVLAKDRSRGSAITRALATRIAKVLRVAAYHEHDALVLGAWGCGVFKNDPEDVARLFADALRGSFAGLFAKVVFAVLDPSPERRFIGPFEERFAAGAPHDKP